MSPSYPTVLCVFKEVIREGLQCKRQFCRLSVVIVWTVPITAVLYVYVGILRNNWKNNLVMH